MKRLFWFALFFAAFLWVVGAYPGLSNQGEFDSIILNFKDDVDVVQLEQQLGPLTNMSGASESPRLNSAFSGSNHVYVLEGIGCGGQTGQSPVDQTTEKIWVERLYPIH